MFENISNHWHFFVCILLKIYQMYRYLLVSGNEVFWHSDNTSNFMLKFINCLLYTSHNDKKVLDEV